MHLDTLSSFTKDIACYAVHTGTLGFVLEGSKEQEHLLHVHAGSLDSSLLSIDGIRNYAEPGFTSLVVVIVRCEHGFVYSYDRDGVTLPELILEAMNASLEERMLTSL